jgi:hypothetical protein
VSACTCSPCGRKFTGLTAFDKHQQVDYSRRPAVACLDPATLGLKQDQYGRWGFPPDARSRARLKNLRAERPRAGVAVSPVPEKAGTGPRQAVS